MSEVFSEIFDEAVEHLEPIAAPPQSKKRRASASAKPKGDTPAAPLSHPADEAGETMASDTSKPLEGPPSSPTIPRKRGRPAKSLAQPTIAAPGVTHSDGLLRRAAHATSAIGEGRGDQSVHELPEGFVAASLIHIVQLWRMRQRWHRAEKSLILQSKAICRAFMAGDKDAANAAYDAAKKGGDVPEEIILALTPFLPAIERFETERKAIEKDLKKTAKSIPAYQWAMGVRGFGELNFVAVVGESSVIEEDGSVRGPGDYRTVSALWKRMGVALINGERQRRVADAELAIAHGYNPSRRSVLFNVGECLIKAGGEYKEIYNERKAYELARDPEIRPILAHRRAARYMTKRLLRKLYAQWRKETRGESGDPDEIVTLPIAAE